MAHTKAIGTTANGRDSQPKYLGVKLSQGQTAKTGNIIVAATQAYNFLTAATVYLDLVLASSGLTATQIANPLIFALTTAQGVAATADILVLGDVLR